MSKTKLCFNSTIYNNDSIHNVMVLSSSQFNKGCSRNRINSKFNLRNNSKQSTELLFQLDTINLSRGKSNNKSKDKKFHSLHTVQSSRNVNRNYFNIQQSYITTTLKGQQQVHQRNNTEINNNTSSMYMGNYNIKDCILRGNTDVVNKKKHILKLKTKNKQKPLSVILINTNNKKHKSNSVEAHPLTSINKIQQHKLTYINNIMLTHNNNNMLSRGKSNTFIKRCKSFKIKTTTIKRTQHPNSLSDHNIFHNNKNNPTTTNSYTSLLSKFLYYINNHKENILTKKEMFKLLKIDIYKNEQKVKEMLDSLKRIQQHNDEDLKRKGFVKNIGFLACQNKI